MDESSGRQDEEQRMNQLGRNPEESHDRAGQLVGCEDAQAVKDVSQITDLSELNRPR